VRDLAQMLLKLNLAKGISGRGLLSDQFSSSFVRAPRRKELHWNDSSLSDLHWYSLLRYLSSRSCKPLIRASTA
jgi:hypothetical protein